MKPVLGADHMQHLDDLPVGRHRAARREHHRQHGRGEHQREHAEPTTTALRAIARMRSTQPR